MNKPEGRISAAKEVVEKIDEYCLTEYDGGHRNHLGASLIGRECSRYLWYVFRWAKREKTSGRQQRLFNRGHREEERFIEWLEGIGIKVFYENYDSNPLYYCVEDNSYHLKADLEKMQDQHPLKILAKEVKQDDNFKLHVNRAKADGLKFPQYRISDVGGHFGGSLDGVAVMPSKDGDFYGPVLLEFKTNGTGKKFEELNAQGMEKAKPEHFAQTSVYGFKFGINYCLYLNINKNDDSIHAEFVKLNHKLGEQMILKAEKIINSQTPPPRISNNPSFFKCSYCNFNGICHKKEEPELNCRSCKNATPVEGGKWFCCVFNSTIPEEFIKKGCLNHRSITNV